MSTERKNRVISSSVTALIMTLVFVVLYFLGLSSPVPPPPAKQMIMIEFTSGGGGGGGSEMPKSAHNVSNSAPDLATQDFEEAPVVTRNPKPSETKTDNNVVASEPRQEPGAAYRPGTGGGSGGGTGTGTGTGAGMGLGSGEGAGAGSGRGIGYGSGNRAYVNIPDVNINETGVVYVEVHVTAQGNVINARILSTQKYPTNITNAKVQEECLARALSAKYVTGKEELRIIVFK
jgi:outer membrane biosynthesis protein TonB